MPSLGATSAVVRTLTGAISCDGTLADMHAYALVPPELLLMIYEIVFEKYYTTTRELPLARARSLLPSRTLLRTCRQLYCQARDLVYKRSKMFWTENTFTVDAYTYLLHPEQNEHDVRDDDLDHIERLVYRIDNWTIENSEWKGTNNGAAILDITKAAVGDNFPWCINPTRARGHSGICRQIAKPGYIEGHMNPYRRCALFMWSDHFEQVGAWEEDCDDDDEVYYEDGKWCVEGMPSREWSAVRADLEAIISRMYGRWRG